MTKKDKLATFDIVEAERDKLRLAIHDLTCETRFPFEHAVEIDIKTDIDGDYIGKYRVSKSNRAMPVYMVEMFYPNGKVQCVNFHTENEIQDAREDVSIYWRMVRHAQWKIGRAKAEIVTRQMTKREAEQRSRFADILCAESTLPFHEANRRADLLMRHGKTYARLQEMNCNGVEWRQGESNESFAKRQDRHEKWVERREGQIEARVKQLVAGLGQGFGAVFSGDPRGTTVKITLPSGKTNDMGREGICVPTA